MRLLFLGVILLLLSSCGPTEWYNYQVSIPETGWHKDTVAVFKSEITQLDKSCHILLDVTHGNNYEYSNIWFFIDAVSPTGHIQRDTVDCYLANHEGTWFGEENGDDQIESLHPYKINIKFPEKGLYKYYIIHGMRDTLLTGVSSIGLQIVEVE